MQRQLQLSLFASLALLVSACITVVPTTNLPASSPTPMPSASPMPPLVRPSVTPTLTPTVTPTATPLPLATPSTGVPPSGVGYDDLFENPATLNSGWQIEDAPNAVSGPSTWKIADGRLVQESNIYREDEEFKYSEGTRAMTRLGPWQNARISVKIQPTDNDGVGVVFRFQDADNYYRLLSVQDSLNKGPYTRLEVKQNGSFRTLAEDKLPLHEQANDGPVPVVITVVGSQIGVEIAGTQRFQVTDNTIGSGKAGLTTYACSAEFTEFRVHLLP